MSLTKLKEQLSHLSNSRADMIDIAEYTKATVHTSQGVYQTGDCEKHHTDSQTPDQPSAAKLYGAGCRFEGHIGDIKACLDENEDVLQLRHVERKE